MKNKQGLIHDCGRRETRLLWISKANELALWEILKQHKGLNTEFPFALMISLLPKEQHGVWALSYFVFFPFLCFLIHEILKMN